MKQITLHSEEVHTKETGTKEGQTVSYKHLKDSMMLSKFDIGRSVHHHTIQTN